MSSFFCVNVLKKEQCIIILKKSSLPYVSITILFVHLKYTF
uniref:Uncharacterized protein n=1 Tax=Arundo donax TaxID=35708 RepID=A0A0A9EJJ4_ARUDO